MTNALAYNDTECIAAVKMFYDQAPGKGRERERERERMRVEVTITDALERLKKTRRQTTTKYTK